MTSKASVKVGSRIKKLNPGFNSCLFQDFISQNSGCNGYGYGEFVSGNGAIPNLMASSALPDSVAALSKQEVPQLRIKPAAHLNVKFAGSQLFKAQQTSRVKLNSIKSGNFWCNFPHPFYQSFVARGFSNDAQGFAVCNPHAAFGIVNNFNSKSIWAHKPNIAPAIADYKSVCYSLLVSREMEFEISLNQRPNRPVRAVLSCPISVTGLGADGAIRKDARPASYGF